MAAQKPVAALEHVEGLIHFVRGQKVMLDFDLAALYGVRTKALNQAVSRNLQRFPPDFMFRLSRKEAAMIMRSRASGGLANRSQFVTSSLKHRGLTHRFYAFTEQGV